MDTDTTQLACPHCLSINRVPDARLGDDPKCGRCGNGLFTGLPLPLTAKNAEALLLKSEQPVSIDAWSDRMSPNRLSVTVTSNCLGARTSCMAALSTYMWLSSTSG